MHVKEIFGPWPFPLSLCISAIAKKIDFHNCALLPWCAVLLQAQSDKAKWWWADTSEIMSQNKSCFFTLFFSAIFTGMEPLTTHSTPLESRYKAEQQAGPRATQQEILVWERFSNWQAKTHMWSSPLENRPEDLPISLRRPAGKSCRTHPWGEGATAEL